MARFDLELRIIPTDMLRLYRQGQTSQTVVIQHIVTKGTVDEHILRSLQAKDKTQNALMEAVKAEMESI